MRKLDLPGVRMAAEGGPSVADFLEKVTLFEELGHRDRRRLARIVHERDYRDGEYICEAGRPGAALFVVRRGLVEVVSLGRDGMEVTRAMLEPPASFEESAALGTAPVRGFSARARGPVSVLELGRSDLDALSVTFPLLANKVLMRLAGIMAMRLQMLLDATYLTESGEHQETKQ